MMKMKIISTALAAMILAACNNQGNTVTDFIPGTYVNQAQSEYSVANDTLLITKAKNTENIYLIVRKTGYRRIGDGKLFPLKHEVKNWTGTWNTQQQVMQIMQAETVLIFQPEQNKLLIQSNAYWKL
ncbi:hypothetical protein [Mucilaginibacter sp.]